MKFTKDHEWAKNEGEKVVIGITEYAAHQLGDVVFVELPTVGDTIEKGSTIGTIESVKTVSDLFAPVSGEIIAVNEELEGNPALVNEDPMGAGWILEVKPSNPAEFDEMLDEEAYKAICE